MERLNQAGTVAGRAIHLRVMIAVTTVALATPGIVTAQSGASDSVSRGSVKPGRATSATPLQLATVYGELRKANPRVQAAEALARAARARVPAGRPAP